MNGVFLEQVIWDEVEASFAIPAQSLSGSSSGSPRRKATAGRGGSASLAWSRDLMAGC
jgi:hypothetical protein